MKICATCAAELHRSDEWLRNPIFPMDECEICGKESRAEPNTARVIVTVDIEPVIAAIFKTQLQTK